MKWLIYGLVDPRTKLVRYVGQSSSGLRRPRHHANPSQLKSKRTHRSSWIKSLQAIGLRYEIAVLEVFASEAPLNDAEQWWIAYGRACGWDLTNHTDGGDGTRGLVFSVTHRQRLSDAHRGRTLSADHRARISIGITGRPASQRVRESLAQRNRTRVWTSEMRKRVSESSKGRRWTDEQRTRLLSQRRGRKLGPRSDETRKKLSAAMKGRPAIGRPRNPPRLRINLLPGVP